jgi:hypothetical protein
MNAISRHAGIADCCWVRGNEIGNALWIRCAQSESVWAKSGKLAVCGSIVRIAVFCVGVELEICNLTSNLALPSAIVVGSRIVTTSLVSENDG